jgi:hypothetical protein
MAPRLALALALILAASTAAPILARQQQPAPVEPTPGGLSPGELQRLFDALTLVQAQDALSLADDKYGQFATRLKTLQETRRRNQQGRMRILQELGRLAGDREQRGGGDDATIRERLKALAEHEQRAGEDLRNAYAALDQVLDLRQQARFRVFEERMERRKFELLMRAQGKRANQPRRRTDPR